MQPTDHGCKEDNGVFLPLWFTGSKMPNVLSETMDPTDVSDRKDDDDEDNDNITEDESENDDDSDSIKINELQYKRSINHLCNQNVPYIHLSYHLKVK